MKPYNWIPKYSHVFELKHDSTIGNKKAARQYGKKEIEKELILNKPCPVCDSDRILHFYTKDYSYCDDCEFEFPLYY